MENSQNEDETVLPPGMELISSTTFGILTLEIPNIIQLNLSQISKDDVRIRAKFWGESNPGKIFSIGKRNDYNSASAPQKSRYPSLRRYQIRCQMEQFYKYLEDMSKLHLTLLDKFDKAFGYVEIDVTSSLKPSLAFGELSPIDAISQILPIYSQNKKEQLKIGEIQIKIECEFDPNLSQFIHGYQTSSTSAFAKNLNNENSHQNDNDLNEESGQMENEFIQQEEEQQEAIQISNRIEELSEGEETNSIRVPTSLLQEKKEKLEYQSKQFLDKVSKKVSLGEELMADIFCGEEDEEDNDDGDFDADHKEKQFDMYDHSEQERGSERDNKIDIFSQQNEDDMDSKRGNDVLEQLFFSLNENNNQKQQQQQLQQNNQDAMNHNKNTKKQEIDQLQKQKQGQIPKSIFNEGNQSMQLPQKLEDNLQQKITKGSSGIQQDTSRTVQNSSTVSVSAHNDSSLNAVSNTNEPSIPNQSLQKKLEKIQSLGQHIFAQKDQIFKNSNAISNQEDAEFDGDANGDEDDIVVPYFQEQKPLPSFQQTSNKNQNLKTQQDQQLNNKEINISSKNDRNDLVEYRIPPANLAMCEMSDSNHIEVKEVQHKVIEKSLIEIPKWDSLELNVLEFNCLHEQLLAKFKQRSIFIAIELPASFDLQPNRANPTLNESYKAFCREVNGEEFIFRQKFHISIEVNSPEALERFKSTSMSLTLNSFILPQADSDKRLMMQIASGSFPFSKLLSQKNPQGNFYVNLSSTLPLNESSTLSKEGNTALDNSNPTLVKLSKKECVESTNPSKVNILGQIKLHLSLSKSNTNRRSLSNNFPASFNANNMENPSSNTNLIKNNNSNNISVQPQRSNNSQRYSSLENNRQSQLSEHLTISSATAAGIPAPFVACSFQILLRLGQLRVFSLSTYSSYNFFARYKIYGSSEQVQSEIQWNNPDPDFHHRLTIPCSLESIQRMIRVPFIIELWNKDEKGNDELIGMININLGNIPRSILLPDFSGINPNIIIAQHTQLLIITNESLPVKQLGSQKDKGQLYVTIAFGSPQQIAKYDASVVFLEQSNRSMTMQNNSSASSQMSSQMKPPMNTMLIRSSVNNKNTHFIGSTHVTENLNQSQHLKNTLQTTGNTSGILDKQPQSGIKTAPLNEEDDIIRQHALTVKPSQIQLLSQTNRFVPQGQQEFKQSQESHDLLEAMVEVMQALNVNILKIQPKLKAFVQNYPGDSQIDNKAFIVFIQGLDVEVKLVELGAVVRVLDYANKGSFRVDYFTGSFASFQRYETQIRRRAESVLKQLITAMDSSGIEANEMERELTRESEFGLMRREKFSGLMKKLNLQGENIPVIVDKIGGMLDVNNDGLLFVSALKDYLDSLEMYGELRKVQLNASWLVDEFEVEFKDQMKNNNFLEKLIRKQKMMLADITDGSPFGMSIWEGLMLIHIIKEKEKIVNSEQLLVEGTQIEKWINSNNQSAKSTARLRQEQIGITSKNEENDLRLKQQSAQGVALKETQHTIATQDLDEIDYLSGMLNSDNNVPKIKRYEGKGKNTKFNEFEDDDEEGEIDDVFNQLNSLSSRQQYSQQSQLSKKQQLHNQTTKTDPKVFFEIEMKFQNVEFLQQFTGSTAVVFCRLGEEELRVEVKQLELNQDNSTTTSYEINYKATKTYRLSADEEISNILQFEKLSLLVDIEIYDVSKHLENSLQGQVSSSQFIDLASHYKVQEFGSHSVKLNIDLKGGSMPSSRKSAATLQVDLICRKKVLSLSDSDNFSGQSSSKRSQVSEEEECLVEKETKIHRNLPKQGYFNVMIQCALNSSQIIKLANCQLQLSIFHEDSYLQEMFGAIPSTTQSNTLTIAHSLPVAITPQILSYMRECTGLLELFTAERNLLGKVQIPLLDLLLAQQINSNVALTLNEQVSFQKQQKFASCYDEYPIQINVSINYNKHQQIFNNNHKSLPNSISASPSSTHQIILVSVSQIFHLLASLTNVWKYFPNYPNRFSLSFKISSQLDSQVQSQAAHFECDFSTSSIINFNMQPLLLATVINSHTTNRLLVQLMNSTLSKPLAEFSIDLLKIQSNLQYFNSIQSKIQFTLQEAYILESCSETSELSSLPSSSSFSSSIALPIRAYARISIIPIDHMQNLKELNLSQILNCIQNNSKSNSSCEFVQNNELQALKQLLQNDTTNQDAASVLNSRNSLSLLSKPSLVKEIINQMCALNLPLTGLADKTQIQEILESYPEVLVHYRQQASMFTKSIDWLSLLFKTGMLGVYSQFLSQTANNQPKELRITLSIERVLNAHELMNGVPPNCLVECPQLKLITPALQRQANPEFNTSQTTHSIQATTKEIIFNLMHKTYNSDPKQSLFCHQLLGSAALRVSAIQDTLQTLKLPILSQSGQATEVLLIITASRQDIQGKNVQQDLQSTLPKQQKEQMQLYQPNRQEQEAQGKSVKFTTVAPENSNNLKQIMDNNDRSASPQQLASFDEENWDQDKNVIDNYHKTLMELGGFDNQSKETQQDALHLDIISAATTPQGSNNNNKSINRQSNNPLNTKANQNDLLFLQTMDDLDMLNAQLGAEMRQQQVKHNEGLLVEPMTQQYQKQERDVFSSKAAMSLMVQSSNQDVNSRAKEIAYQSEGVYRQSKAQEYLSDFPEARLYQGNEDDEDQNSEEDFQAIRETLKQLTVTQDDRFQKYEDTEEGFQEINKGRKNDKNDYQQEKFKDWDARYARVIPQETGNMEDEEEEEEEDQDREDIVKKYEYGRKQSPQQNNNSIKSKNVDCLNDNSLDFSTSKVSANAFEDRFLQHREQLSPIPDKSNSQKIPQQKQQYYAQYSNYLQDKTKLPAQLESKKNTQQFEDQINQEQPRRWFRQSPQEQKYNKDSSSDDDEDEKERLRREGSLQRNRIAEAKGQLQATGNSPSIKGSLIMKPPINKSNPQVTKSTSTQKISSNYQEKTVIPQKNQAEIDRIANIMRQDFSKQKRYFDSSSDEDDS